MADVVIEKIATVVVTSLSCRAVIIPSLCCHCLLTVFRMSHFSVPENFVPSICCYSEFLPISSDFGEAITSAIDCVPQLAKYRLISCLASGAVICVCTALLAAILVSVY